MDNVPSDSTILLVDDEEQVLKTSEFILRTEGLRSVLLCRDGREVPGLMKQHPVAVVVLDIMMPHIAGKEVLAGIVQEHPEVPVIMMTGLHDPANVVECMRLGAFDYLDKPVENLRLVTSVRRALEYREMQGVNRVLKKHLLGRNSEVAEVFSGILTRSESMFAIFRYLEAIAATTRAVLITGETGTGKELVAKAVHELSGRKGRFIAVNVAGLDDNLFSDTLFGHKRGAFTGADAQRSGLVEQAQGGTLFLDEIGDLAIPSQVKLLRLLQENEYYPLGSDAKKASDARIIVATSREIRSIAQQGDFRKDLYFRLQAHQVHLPPLRERREDIPLLVEHCLKEASRSLGRPVPALPPAALDRLSRYSFPGNVRELEAMIFNAASQQSQSGTQVLDSIERDISLSISGDGPEAAHPPGGAAQDVLNFGGSKSLPTIEEAVDRLVEAALERSHGNQSMAARVLGITRQGLIARLKRKQLEAPKQS